MQTKEQLQQLFRQNVDTIASDLVDAFGLKFEETISNLSEPLLRWLDFTTRYVDPKPRQVLRSNRFPKTLAPAAQAALERFEEMLESGHEVNGFQSKGLFLHNDVSGAKRQQRTDLLWADWGIHHFHLTSAPNSPGSYFSPRSEWLIFCLITDDSVGLIDVRHHSEQDVFSNPDLINTVAEHWPEFMERFRVHGVLGTTSQGRTPGQISELRRGGISSFAKIGAQVFVGPGLGVTSASTPTRVSLARDKVHRYARELTKFVHDPLGQFVVESRSSNVSEPRFSLVLTAQGLSVYEECQSKAFVLPRLSDTESQSFISEFHDILAPKWAVNRIVGSAV